MRACRGGVARAHLIPLKLDGGLLIELFTHSGVGTLVSTENLEALREATSDDVGGILKLIEPLEADGTLVKRARELIEREIGQFSVFEHDGFIQGCAALYSFDEACMGELACLTVHSEYREGGLGERLMKRIEARARGRPHAPVRADHAHLALVPEARVHDGQGRGSAGAAAADVQLAAPLAGADQVALTGTHKMARMIHCIKLGKEAEGLEFPPVPGELGRRIYESVSKEAWQQWQRHQTMLLNENRLSLADARARKYLQAQMEQYFFGDGADMPTGYTPPR